MTNEQLHRRVLHGLAMFLFVVCSLLVVAPLALSPTTALMDKFFGMDVPLPFQRALVVALGASGLVGAVLMITFRPEAWYVLIASGVLGVVQGLLSVPAFLPTAMNIACVVYLFTVRPLYFPAARSR